MTKQDKSLILKYEKNIVTAGKADYTRMMPTYALEQLQEIYNREMKTDLRTNFTCGHCVLTFLKNFYKNIYVNL